MNIRGLGSVLVVIRKYAIDITIAVNHAIQYPIAITDGGLE